MSGKGLFQMSSNGFWNRPFFFVKIKGNQVKAILDLCFYYKKVGRGLEKPDGPLNSHYMKFFFTQRIRLNANKAFIITVYPQAVIVLVVPVVL